MLFIFNKLRYNSDLLIAQPYLHQGENTESEEFARASLNNFSFLLLPKLIYS